MKFSKLLSILLLITIILSSTAACNSNKQVQETTSPTNETEAPITFLPTFDYYIIRNEALASDKSIIDAVSYIRNAISNIYDKINKLADDWYRESDVLVPREYEILIGYTNRPQSQKIYASLGVNDYAYHVESENVIIICGGSPEATLKAVKKFCEDAFNYTEDTKTGEKKELTVGMSYTYRAEYDFISTLINGIDIKDYTIAVKSTSSFAAVSALSNALGKYTGYNIPAKLFKDLDGSEKAVICIGSGDREGNHIRQLGNNTYHIKTISSNSSVLTFAVDYQQSKLQTIAIEALIERLTVKKSRDTVNIQLPDEYVGYSFGNKIPEWLGVTSKKEQIADGVEYIKQEYKDPAGKPYKAYVLIIDPTKATLYMGSANDGYDASLGGKTKYNVASHMKSAVANGINVIAGINADFFDISGDYHPRGLAIKNGQVISAAGDRPWCGITNDGEFVIGTADEYNKQYKGKLVTAVGGSHIIAKDGLPHDIAIDTEFSYTSHPRTLAGVTKDGKIILVVVDGRQASISNGAPLARCAILMLTLGAEKAINLDGGGSSCMVIRNGSTYATKNSPSDGSLRKVYNSLLVVGK